MGAIHIPKSSSSSHVCCCTCFSSGTVLGAARSLQHPLSSGAEAVLGPRLGLALLWALSQHLELGPWRCLGLGSSLWGYCGASTSSVQGKIRVLSCSGSCGKGGSAGPDTGVPRVPLASAQNFLLCPQPAPCHRHPLLPIPRPLCWGPQQPGCCLGRSHSPRDTSTVTGRGWLITAGEWQKG